MATRYVLPLESLRMTGEYELMLDVMVPDAPATSRSIDRLHALLSIGSSYGGVRHALPIYPLLAVLAAVPIHFVVFHGVRLLVSGPLVLLLGAIVSAVPVMRPREYFNEFAGGLDENVTLGVSTYDGRKRALRR